MSIPLRLRPPVPSVEEFRDFCKLCDEIEDAPASDVQPLLDRWNARAGREYRQAEFKTYYGAVDKETFVGEMLLGVPAFVPDLTYAELREVLRSRLAGELSEAVDSYYLNWLEVNLPGADVSGLLDWPNQWFGDEAMLHVELSVDQILAYALARCGRTFPDAPRRADAVPGAGEGTRGTTRWALNSPPSRIKRPSSAGCASGSPATGCASRWRTAAPGCSP